MENNGKLLRGFKLESDVTCCSVFMRSLLFIGWRRGCQGQSGSRDMC